MKTSGISGRAIKFSAAKTTKVSRKSIVSAKNPLNAIPTPWATFETAIRIENIDAAILESVKFIESAK